MAKKKRAGAKPVAVLAPATCLRHADQSLSFPTPEGPRCPGCHTMQLHHAAETGSLPHETFTRERPKQADGRPYCAKCGAAGRMTGEPPECNRCWALLFALDIASQRHPWRPGLREVLREAQGHPAQDDEYGPVAPAQRGAAVLSMEAHFAGMSPLKAAHKWLQMEPGVRTHEWAGFVQHLNDWISFQESLREEYDREPVPHLTLRDLLHGWPKYLHDAARAEGHEDDVEVARAVHKKLAEVLTDEDLERITDELAQVEAVQLLAYENERLHRRLYRREGEALRERLVGHVLEELESTPKHWIFYEYAMFHRSESSLAWARNVPPALQLSTHLALPALGLAVPVTSLEAEHVQAAITRAKKRKPAARANLIKDAPKEAPETKLPAFSQESLEFVLEEAQRLARGDYDVVYAAKTGRARQKKQYVTAGKRDWVILTDPRHLQARNACYLVVDPEGTVTKEGPWPKSKAERRIVPIEERPPVMQSRSAATVHRQRIDEKGGNPPFPTSMTCEGCSASFFAGDMIREPIEDGFKPYCTECAAQIGLEPVDPNSPPPKPRRTREPKEEDRDVRPITIEVVFQRDKNGCWYDGTAKPGITSGNVFGGTRPDAKTHKEFLNVVGSVVLSQVRSHKDAQRPFRFKLWLAKRGGKKRPLDLPADAARAVQEHNEEYRKRKPNPAALKAKEPTPPYMVPKPARSRWDALALDASGKLWVDPQHQAAWGNREDLMKLFGALPREEGFVVQGHPLAREFGLPGEPDEVLPNGNGLYELPNGKALLVAPVGDWE